MLWVTPDIAAAPEQAFKVAYDMALKALLAKLGEPSSGPLKNLAEEAKKANEMQAGR